ncbi:MAG TPA: hypothetical protein P5081_22560 [Phycisphaerae bacterium]|nr:hypothetical protein [Phycisphaerae bacterium]HRW55665.1 hypothetical protein [Phycisphaerae bacterium]
MTAILEPLRPKTDEPCADALDSAPTPETPDTPAAPEDAIPLESMTWPELKRVARDFDLKLNVKKSVLIRQIRDARVAVVKDQAHRETWRGRLEVFWGASKRRAEEARTRFADWWKADATPDVDVSRSASAPAGAPPRWKKLAIWGGGILAGGVAAVVAALM